MSQRMGVRLVHMVLAAFTAAMVLGMPPPLWADNLVEFPILVAVGSNEQGALEVMLMQWDQKSSPDPLALKWANSRVKFAVTYLDTVQKALRYAIRQTTGTPLSGTILVKGAAYAPTTTDGPSAGAVMTVGFLALFRGDRIQHGIAMTGTIDPDGRIGPVGSIPDKVRAAAREGYRTVLIPQGQLYDQRWNLPSLAMRLNLTLREVSTIDEAYAAMTGRH